MALATRPSAGADEGQRCRCCGREVYQPTRGRCGYCAARPEQGGCLRFHGEALRSYLDERCAHGACTPELARWWVAQDDIHLARRETKKVKITYM